MDTISLYTYLQEIITIRRWCKFCTLKYYLSRLKSFYEEGTIQINYKIQHCVCFHLLSFFFLVLLFIFI